MICRAGRDGRDHILEFADDEGRGQPTAADASTTGKKKPILWMVITGIAVVAAIGVGLWAVNVHEDLEEQEAATQAAEAEAAAQAEAAAAAAECLDHAHALTCEPGRAPPGA